MITLIKGLESLEEQICTEGILSDLLEQDAGNVVSLTLKRIINAQSVHLLRKHHTLPNSRSSHEHLCLQTGASPVHSGHQNFKLLLHVGVVLNSKKNGEGEGQRTESEGIHRVYAYDFGVGADKFLNVILVHNYNFLFTVLLEEGCLNLPERIGRSGGSAVDGWRGSSFQISVEGGGDEAHGDAGEKIQKGE